jgi:hypothetical protein
MEILTMKRLFNGKFLSPSKTLVVLALALGPIGQQLAMGQGVVLTAIKPEQVFSYFPSQDAAPVVSEMIVPGETTPEQVLTFKVESEVTYKVPPNYERFSGVFLYEPPSLSVPDGEQPYHTPALVRILVDGKPVLEQGLTEKTPPLQFSVPVAGASQITITSKTAFVGNVFSIARARFTSSKDQPFQYFLPAVRQGFVDNSPLPRQRIYGIFQGGENVPVHAFFSGSASQAIVTMHFTPEHSGTPEFANVVNIPMVPTSQVLSQGTAIWKVPESFGPGTLEISQTISGQVVFTDKQRIAIGPTTDLSRVSDSNFGVHASTNGYPLIYDDFMGVWGAKWGRIFLHWESIEPHKGEYDFSRADALVNIYLAQNMRILLVVGEDAPAWVGGAGPQYSDEWQSYVKQATHHFAGKVSAWDVFNEVDVKYTASVAKGAPVDWDLEVLRSGIRAIREADPRATIVCCSTGTTQWLLYDKKLLDASVLSSVDAISLHPYQPGPPEVKDGAFNYPQRISAVSSLASSAGVQKPIWSTEANWIIGAPGVTDISAPGVTEQEQAKYVVRTNLLSSAMGVKYFLHAPFAHRSRPQTHLSTWAAYAEMAHLFSESSNPRILLSGPQVYSFVATTSNGAHVGAVWSVVKGADVRISNDREIFLDMYGNRVNGDPVTLHLSEEPLYFAGNGAPPEVIVLRQSPSPAWRLFPQVATWTCTRGTNCAQVTGGLHIQSLPSKYGYQLMSPVMNIPADSCQLIHLALSLEKGAVGVFAMDASTGKMMGRSTYAAWVPDSRSHDMEFRIHTNSGTGSMKLVLANANFTDMVSSFVVLNRPQIGDCP